MDGEVITGNIPSQGAQTITPGMTAQQIPAGKYLSGAQTIAGDANLKAENIAEGVSIFGVTGTFEGATKNAVTITIDQYLTGGYLCYTNADGIVTVYNTQKTDDTIQAIEGTLIACFAKRGCGWFSDTEAIAGANDSNAYIAEAGLTLEFVGGI